jgi:P-type conjugative transfer protein TrbJ
MATTGRITGSWTEGVGPKRSGGGSGAHDKSRPDTKGRNDMTRIVPTLLMGMMLYCFVSKSAVSYAQYGPLIVYDPWNHATNTITATQMILQVLNSTKEVQMMLQNLMRTGGSWGDALTLLRRLDEVLATGEALHYQLQNLDQQLRERYPGYVNPGRWIPKYTQWTNTSLDTLRGTLDTVHEQLKVSERLREEAVVASLRAKTEGAMGNLDVSQTGNMIELQIVEELRKVRQLLGASLNAQNVTQVHQINLQASQERIMNDWIERSQIPVQPYHGTGGFGPDDYRH